jgi:hypothetical protein
LEKQNGRLHKKTFFYDCVVDDEKIYFPLANYNALCSTNIQSGLTEIIDFFPNEKMNRFSIVVFIV